MTDEVKKLLEDTRELLSDPTHWTQKSEARTESGLDVTAKHSEAVCWCMLGALYFNSSDDYVVGYETRAVIRSAILEAIPSMVSVERISISVFNDDPKRKHEEVISVLDRAIEMVS